MTWRDIWYEPETERLRSGWRVLAFLLVAFATSMLFFVVLAMVAIAAGLDWKADAPLLANAMLYLAFLPGILAASLWAVQALDKLPVRTLGFNTNWPWMRTMLLGVGLGLALIGLLVLVLWAGGFAHVTWQQVDRQALLLLFGVAVFLFMASAFEELLFRGYMFQTLLRGIGPLATLLLTSAAFTAVHLQNPSVHPLALTNIFLAGVFFGMLYLRLGSLAIPIGLHTGWNLAQLLLGIPVSGNTLQVATPATTRLLGEHLLLTGGGFGLEGTVSVSVLLLGLIAAVAYSRHGMPLHARWWEWRELLARPSMSPPWDFTLGSRYYQWKLQHDSTE